MGNSDQPVDLRGDSEPEPPDLVGTAARRFRRRLVVIGAVVAVIATLAGMALAPGAVRPGEGTFGFSADLGDTFYVGFPGTVTAPVQLLWAQPLASAGLEARLEVCQQTSPGMAIGLVREAEVDELCSKLKPVSPGVRVGPSPPHGTSDEYLVVRLVPTAEGHQAFCGIRVLYRSSLRIGFILAAGEAGRINVPRLPDGEFVDDDAPREPC